MITFQAYLSILLLLLLKRLYNHLNLPTYGDVATFSYYFVIKL